MRRALFACALVALAACRRSTAETPAPTLAALSVLRDALARNELRGAVDPLPLARAELLERLARMHDLQEDRDAVGITEDGWRRALANLDASYARAGLAREFNRARPLLGTGPCAQTSATPLPDALSPVTSRRPTWPAFVDTEVRAPIARRADRARAATFRCEGGSAEFLAVFLPREEGDGLVVARITAR